jgi:hypothetical protein
MVHKANYFPLYEVKICGVRYDVREVDDLRDESGEKRFYGRISHVHLTMDIEENMAREVKIRSVLHEALHGLFHQTGNYDIEQEERIVQMLGCQLPQFLRENRALVDLIMGDSGQSQSTESPLVCNMCGSKLRSNAIATLDGFVFCSVTCADKHSNSTR